MENQFRGNNHSIGLDAAKKMTRRFRAQKDNLVRNEYHGKHMLPNCESFDRIPFDILLQREDCKGIRIYYGMNDTSLQMHAIIVGFDEQGRDILPQANQVLDGTDPEIIQGGLPCPSYCPPPSDLNT